MNFLMFDLGIRAYGVQLPSDEGNNSSSLSKSYLRLALLAGTLFQLWHAFSTEMFGCHVLLVFAIAVHGPWAKFFLPARLVKRHIWAKLDVSHRTRHIEMVPVNRSSQG